MTVPTAARRRRTPGRRLRPGAATRLVVHAAAGAAWVVLVALALRAAMDAGPAHAGHAGHAGHAAPGGGATLADWMVGYGLMVIAMMWPLAAPAAALVGRSSFPSRRTLHVGVLLAVTTVLWLAFGAVLYAVTLPLGPDAARWWPVLWLAVALAVTWAPRRARLLWACLRLPPLFPSGRRGLVTAARAGWVFWCRCALLCGPVMAAMVTHHGLLVMALASVAVWWEQWHPRARRDPVPRVLLGAALLATVLGLP